MNNANTELVTAMCNAMIERDIDAVTAHLTEDVFYHNLPFEPILGRSGVEKFLRPFINSAHGGLLRIEYHHTLCDGDIVMNARDETWTHKGTTVVLPVAGVFKIENGLISRWCDYWDTATLQPIVEAM